MSRAAVPGPYSAAANSRTAAVSFCRSSVGMDRAPRKGEPRGAIAHAPRGWVCQDSDAAEVVAHGARQQAGVPGGTVGEGAVDRLVVEAAVAVRAPVLPV